MRLGVWTTLCFAVLVLVAAAASPAARTPVVHGSVAFWDAKRGLVGTGQPFCEGDCGKGRVLVTANGGKSWKPSLKTTGAIVQLDTAGRNAAWAVAQRCVDIACRSRVWRTSNGGRSWSVVGSGLTAVSFATPRVGLGLRTTPTVSRLFRSYNGGRAWRPLRSPCRGQEPTATVVSLVTPRHGFVVCTGPPGAGAQNKSVFETTNGGSTWRRRIRAQLGSGTVTSLPTNGYVLGASFTPGGFGALCQVRGVFLVTRNGARTWTPAKVVRPAIDTCSAVAAAPGATFAIVQTRQRDRLVVSTNGGRKWRVLARF